MFDLSTIKTIFQEIKDMPSDEIGKSLGEKKELDFEAVKKDLAEYESHDMQAKEPHYVEIRSKLDSKEKLVILIDGGQNEFCFKLYSFVSNNEFSNIFCEQVEDQDQVEAKKIKEEFKKQLISAFVWIYQYKSADHNGISIQNIIDKLEIKEEESFEHVKTKDGQFIVDKNHKYKLSVFKANANQIKVKITTPNKEDEMTLNNFSKDKEKVLSNIKEKFDRAIAASTKNSADIIGKIFKFFSENKTEMFNMNEECAEKPEKGIVQEEREKIDHNPLNLDKCHLENNDIEHFFYVPQEKPDDLNSFGIYFLDYYNPELVEKYKTPLVEYQIPDLESYFKEHNFLYLGFPILPIFRKIFIFVFYYDEGLFQNYFIRFNTQFFSSDFLIPNNFELDENVKNILNQVVNHYKSLVQNSNNLGSAKTLDEKAILESIFKAISGDDHHINICHKEIDANNPGKDVEVFQTEDKAENGDQKCAKDEKKLLFKLKMKGEKKIEFNLTIYDPFVVENGNKKVHFIDYTFYDKYPYDYSHVLVNYIKDAYSMFKNEISTYADDGLKKIFLAKFNH